MDEANKGFMTMQNENMSYVEPPTIPEGMTCQEYRRKRDRCRPPLHRRLTARMRRALRA